MSIIGIILVLIVIGFLLWLVETQIPLDPLIRKVIRIVIIVLVVIWLLQIFGVWGSLMSARI